MEHQTITHTGDAFSKLGVFIAIALIVAGLVFESHTEGDRDQRDLESRRDTCVSLSQNFDSQVSTLVKDFNYCMEHAR